MNTRAMADLMGELNARSRLIVDPSICVFVRKMLESAPAAFYERPASTHHHALDEREEGGNLLHTVRVIDLVLIMADVCRINKASKDILVASAILHDMFRHGIDGEQEYSCASHPALVRNVAEANNLMCRHYDAIMEAVEHHMGRWGSLPFTPHLTIKDILHLADSIDARWLEDLACTSTTSPIPR